MSRQILVVAAHPDDEVLGCGASIRRHIDEGDSVAIIFMADGESARQMEQIEQAVEERENCARSAAKILGADRMEFLRFPDNQMDTVPFLSIVQALEKQIQNIAPAVVYTHYIDDLNIDHQITAKAVFTACRPSPGQSVKEIYLFEIPSSTNWSSITNGQSFNPTMFIDVSSSYQAKMDALQVYANELLPYPHVRSMDAIEDLLKLRGAIVGCTHAEAFMAERILK